MRRGEILSLRWPRVDRKRGVLSSQDTKTGYKRYIPISGELEKVLTEIPRCIDHGYVFCGPDGEPIGEFKTSWTSALKAAGIKGFRFHDLRHTCITRWRRAGVDLLTITAMSGHKTTSIFKRYNTFVVDDLTRAAAQVERFEAQNGDFLETCSGGGE